MKQYLTLIAMLLSALAYSATYYTCASPSGTNVSSLSDGSTCTINLATWNQSSNTLIVRNGSSFSISGVATLNAILVVEAGGTLTIAGGGNDLDFKKSVSVDGTLNLSFTANKSAIFEEALTINGTLDLSGSVDVTIDLSTGSGNMIVTGTISNSLDSGKKGKLKSPAGRIVYLTSTATVAMTDEFKPIEFEMEQGATLNVGKFKMESGGYAVINGTINVSDVLPYLQGKVEIKSPTIVNGSITTTQEFKLKGGNILGQGTIGSSTGTWTRDGAETINGFTNWDAIFAANNLDLSALGFTWNGTNWGATGLPGLAPSSKANLGADDWGILTGVSYSTSVDGTFGAGGATINSPYSLTFDASDDLTNFVSVKNNGHLVFVNNAHLGAEFTLTGSGDVKLIRNFATSLAWYRIGFAVSSGTVADLVANFPIRDISYPENQRNIFYWDASAADWVACSTTTPLAGNSFVIYAFGTGLNISITRPNSGFNNNSLSQTLDYNNGQSSPYLSGDVSETEGWNMHHNPFQAYIDWSNVTGALSSSGYFTNTAVAVMNNDGNYVYWNTGGGTNAQWIAPFQSFFVQDISGGSYPGSFTYTTAMISSSPGSEVSTFKTGKTENLILSANGPGGIVQTEVVVNKDATDAFDGAFDAYWLGGAGAKFYTLDANGVKYGLNQSENHKKNEIPLAFAHPTDGASFTISIDPATTINKKVYIEDLYTNTTHTLTDNSPYTFTNATAAPVDRFIISLKKPKKNKKTDGFNDLSDSDNDLTAVWIANDNLVIKSWETLENVDVKVYNNVGQLLVSNHYNTLNEETISINGKGLFIVYITTADGTQIIQKAIKL